MPGVVTRSWESPDPQRLSRRAQEASDGARRANETVRSVLRHIVHALVAGRSHEQLVNAARVALEADGSAAAASEAAREATIAAAASDAEQLDLAADRAQAHLTDAAVFADRAMELIPPE
jgi:hypothetical protein